MKGKATQFQQIHFVHYFNMHVLLYLAVSHNYGSRFHCLNMIKMSDVNNTDQNDTDIAFLKVTSLFVYYC